MVKNPRHKLENSSKDQMDTRSRRLEDLWSIGNNVKHEKLDSKHGSLK